MRKVTGLLAIIISVVIFVGVAVYYKNIKDNGFLTKKTVISYFHKGVYRSYLLNTEKSNSDDFYIFYDDKSGYTQDGEMGIGLPYSCAQINGYVKFRFGGVDEPEEILTIQSAEDAKITGSFKDGLIHEFVLIPNANPDDFDAVEYTKTGKPNK